MKRIRLEYKGFLWKERKPCKYKDDVNIGSYDCGDCEYFKGIVRINKKKYKVKCIADEGLYFSTVTIGNIG